MLLQPDSRTPVAISDMHHECMLYLVVIYTPSYKMEMLSHAEHKSERLNESICKGQTTQAERQKNTQPEQNVTTSPISHSISATPGAGIEIQLGNGLEIQQPL